MAEANYLHYIEVEVPGRIFSTRSLDIDVSISKSKDSSQATISIYNLNNDSKNAFIRQGGWVKVRIIQGSKSTQVYYGQVLGCSMNMDGDTTLKYTIQSDGGATTLANTFVSGSISTGCPVDEVVGTVIDQANRYLYPEGYTGLTTGELIKIKESTPVIEYKATQAAGDYSIASIGEYLDGGHKGATTYTYKGPVDRVLKKIARDAGGIVITDEMNVTLLKNGNAAKTKGGGAGGTVLTTNDLYNTPSKSVSISKKTKTKSGGVAKESYSIKCMPLAAFSYGGLVKVIGSKFIPENFFAIDSCSMDLSKRSISSNLNIISVADFEEKEKDEQSSTDPIYDNEHDPDEGKG